MTATPSDPSSESAAAPPPAAAPSGATPPTSTQSGAAGSAPVPPRIPRVPTPRAQHFRGSLGRFATGVAIVAFDGRSKRFGLTVNSFTSVSLEPPLVLVSIARTTKAHDELAGRPFSVNILGAEQQQLAMHFAGRPTEEPRWIEGGTAPRLAGVLAFFECTPWAAYDGGDHTLYLGQVVHFDYRRGDALAYVNSRFTTIPESLLGVEDLL